MFKAIKVLNRKQFTNPQVNDKDEKKVTSPTEIQNIITKNFKSKFRDERTEDIQPFSGQPRALNNPISEKEVRQSIKQLNNGRAPREDNICNEYLKFAPEILDNQIAMIINKTFENHEDLDINNGILVALPKPGKPKGPPQNLRPVTLLNSIRKVLSTIALTRIRPAVENYISCSQSGFRPNRSTSDVVWAHRWISAKVLNYADIEIDITGIDMSAAFDTIDRKQLLQLLTNLVTEDEKRIIQFLLSNTTLNVKISGANTEEPFLTNIGTPQGDSLSPVLFIIYLEQALENVRSTLDSPSNTTEAHLPNEIAYADDIDFIGNKPVNVKKIEEILKVHKLKVNVDKTEHTSVRKHSEEWKTSKKVGSLLGSKEDIEHRKHLSNIALNKMEQIWHKADKTKQRTRIKLYNTLVRSVLLYNCGTWAMTKTDEEKLDSFHRKQLRRVLGIWYPTKISNKSLYKKCEQTPISLEVLQARWRLFGHVLRREPSIPANKAMAFYFHDNAKRARGRPITTLPMTLNNHLKILQNRSISLTSQKDLETIRKIAKRRQEWTTFTADIKKAAEAARSDDTPSGRP